MTFIVRSTLAYDFEQILFCPLHGMTLVTRNIADFAPMGLTVVNPWNQER